MTVTDKLLLEKMLVHIDEVTEDIGSMSYDDFINDRKTLKSAVFDVAQVFELAKGTADKHMSLKLTPETYALIDGIYMKAISKTRAVSVHRYETLDLKMFWSLLKDGLPKLREIIESVLLK
ncbi:MAG: DUF86 domain-containing protein [Oscillospiraceae bacterium]|nr:DUF86 domain-containing protein [Oscillospiraceae bacterium]